MFNPDASALNEKKLADERRREAFKNIERWTLELIPSDLREQAIVSTQEVVCGEPDCSPIDTAVAIVFEAGGDGMVGLPMMAHEVTMEELKAKFPTRDVLQKWHRGEFAEWPPFEEEELPQLRFAVGGRVRCRIGPDATKDWMPGTITQLWYTESKWPEGSYAPYRVKLDDGRDIFAPGDMDQVIRKLPEGEDAARSTTE